MCRFWRGGRTWWWGLEEGRGLREGELGEVDDKAEVWGCGGGVLFGADGCGSCDAQTTRNR